MHCISRQQKVHVLLQNLDFGMSWARPSGEEGERERERGGEFIVDLWERRTMALEDVTMIVCLQGGLEPVWKYEQRDSNAAVR